MVRVSNGERDGRFKFISKPEEATDSMRFEVGHNGVVGVQRKCTEINRRLRFLGSYFVQRSVFGTVTRGSGVTWGAIERAPNGYQSRKLWTSDK